jgi:hypothetical protein
MNPKNIQEQRQPPRIVLGIDISHESSWRPEHHQYTSSARHLATLEGRGSTFNDGEGLLAAVVVTLANQLSTGNGRSASSTAPTGKRYRASPPCLHAAAHDVCEKDA